MNKRLRLLFNTYFNTKDLGQLFFYIGLFLLPSAFTIGALFLIISLVKSFYDDRNFLVQIFLNRWNLIFLVSAFMLILSSLINFFNPESINNLSGDSYLELLGLLNWIPLIFTFIGFQKYLSSNINRKKVSQVLIAGSIPVIFSVIAQVIFNWQTKMETLYGLIVWYQKKLIEDLGHTGVTGLFSNPNYLGAWLVIILPFCIYLIYIEKRISFRWIVSSFILLFVCILIVLTTSRAAWVCLFLSIPLVNGRKISKLFLRIFGGIISFAFLFYLTISTELSILLKGLIPVGIWKELNTANISPRIRIWDTAVKLISENPLFGSGASSFSSIFHKETGLWQGHAHNLPLELMVSYGVLASLLILLPVSLILFKSFVKSYRDSSIELSSIIHDRAWVSSLLLLFFMHLVDIQYLDGRISILGWLLLAGAKSIMDEKKFTDSAHN